MRIREIMITKEKKLMEDRVSEKMMDDETLPDDYSKEEFFEDLRSILEKELGDSKRSFIEAKHLMSIYGEEEGVNYEEFMNNVVPKAIKFLKIDDSFSLSEISSVKSLEERLKQGLDYFRDPLFSYYYDVEHEGKLLRELNKKLYNDVYKPYGLNFRHFITKTELKLKNGNIPVQNIEKVTTDLIKIYINDKNLNYYDFFNSFLPKVIEYLKKSNKNTLSGIKSREEFEKIVNK